MSLSAASRSLTRLCRGTVVTTCFCLCALLFAGCSTTRPIDPQEAKAGQWGRPGASAAGQPTEPPGQDTDRDTIPDERERALKSDPRNPDTDKDSFDDGFEDMLAEYGFDLLVASRDSDQDGLEDDLERKLGTNPERPDSDGDGWSDFDEQLNRYFGYDPMVPSADADFDGLTDNLETRIGSAPDRVDTNGDGVDDFPAYSAGINPAGEKIEGGLGEIISTPYSPAMRDAIRAIRTGRKFEHFPENLAGELPYPRVTRALAAAGQVKPSAALMQRSVFNPHNSPGIYDTYNDIVSKLSAIANEFDGNPGPDIVRMFHWTQRTIEDLERPGRTIYALKISDNPGVNENEPEVAFLGMHHARELVTTSLTFRVIDDLTKGYKAGDVEIRKHVDNAEIWLIPVVNPNGYERALTAQDDWRKNTRRVSPQQQRLGVDLNRNYGFAHATSLTQAQRAGLDQNTRYANGITNNGSFDIDNPQFPGIAAFTEVETQAVRGLAHNQFATEPRNQVDGLICSLSWHTYGGVVGHPLGHKPIPPATDLSGADRATLGGLTDGIAVAVGFGYKNIKDGFRNLSVANGDTINGYSVFGDSDDWLFKDKHTYAILIEAYSPQEGLVGFNFGPTDAAGRDAVTLHNFQGALHLIKNCRP